MNEYANGYLASCESNLLRVTIDKIRSLTALVNVAVPKELFFRSSGKAEHLRRPFLSVYYKPTQTRNETHFDGTQTNKWLRLVEKVNYNPGLQGIYFYSYLLFFIFSWNRRVNQSYEACKRDKRFMKIPDTEDQFQGAGVLGHPSPP